LIWPTTPLLLARGRLRAATGDSAAAIEDLIATGDRVADWGLSNPAMTPWRSSAVAPLLAAQARTEAIRLATEELRLARRWGAPRAIGVALRALGTARGGQRGIQLLSEAAATLRDARSPVEQGRALFELGASLRRGGARAEAREHLRRCLDLAHRYGAIALADQAREELLVAGARPRRDALRGRDALTSSELRVARLAAEGRTNKEIAQLLFITQRTVETHLTSGYAKLGIRSRRDLERVLHTQDSAQDHPFGGGRRLGVSQAHHPERGE
jgi:DNA-binding CsgD family transcriptional regulator